VLMVFARRVMRQDPIEQMSVSKPMSSPASANRRERWVSRLRRLLDGPSLPTLMASRSQFLAHRSGMGRSLHPGRTLAAPLPRPP
jgi:hypothetical protein